MALASLDTHNTYRIPIPNITIWETGELENIDPLPFMPRCRSKLWHFGATPRQLWTLGTIFRKDLHRTTTTTHSLDVARFIMLLRIWMCIHNYHDKSHLHEISLIWWIWRHRWRSRCDTLCTHVTAFCDSGFTAPSLTTTFGSYNQVNSSSTLVYPCTISNMHILLFTT